MDVKALIEQRVGLNEKNKALLDKAESEKRSLTAEEQQVFRGQSEEIDRIKATLDAHAQHEAEEKALGESRGRQTETTAASMVAPSRAEDMALAFRGWMNGKEATDEQIAAGKRVGLNVFKSQIEGRALSVGTTDAGGYSVPDELMRSYYEFQKWFGPVRGLATVIPTASGAVLPWPTINDTSNTGEIIGEGSPVTTTADPTFGQVNLNAFKYSSKAVIVSRELLQDSSVNLAAYLGKALGTRIGRIQNTHFTTGAGTTVPFGIVTQSSSGKVATATNAITLDEVIDLVHSVDPAYRPRGAFMLHDTSAAYVRKLKDSQNRYLWEMSTQIGQPDRLFGYPVFTNNDMASTMSSSARIMLFGDFSTYLIRDAGQVEFARADELRVLNHQVVFLAFQRSDGNLLDTTAVKHLKMASS